MTSDAVYLRPNAIAEPLINQWYAWIYLIPPPSAAMFLANSHVKLMQSFAEDPQIHVAALQNPALAGGPFIGHGAEEAGAVRALADRIVRERAGLISLAGAIHELDRLVAERGDGMSLEPLYAQIPAPLRGMVELTYDVNGQPAVRYFEPLFYESEHYDPSAQSFAISLAKSDARGYGLSTPRLPRPDVLMLDVPFASEHLDALFRMRHTPGSYDEIRERLGVRAGDEPLFRSFFSAEPPPRRPVHASEEPRLTYYGHACVLMESAGTSVLFDPIIAYQHGGPGERFTHDDLPERIDYVVLTHNHQDHCLLETLIDLRHKIGTIVVPRSKGDCRVDPSLRLALERIGFPRVLELGPMESLAIPGGRITALPFLGEHADLDIRTKAGFAVAMGGRTALFLADSNNLDPKLYDRIHDRIGDADVVFIGMECEGAQMSWLYGPLLTKPVPRKHDRSRRFTGSDFERGWPIIERFRPEQVYIYAMGQEPWMGHIMVMHYTPESLPIVESDRLVQRCREAGITAERLYGCKRIGMGRAGRAS
ncbi:MBL fold metallo-hydrolase [Sorangium sp. So ce1099]|uniref:MBL fold metallo-hydrolase n=1 Tax=Sorangium sp. So ce1099 TaxID=3133331 RepID=UPI003F63527F